MVLIAVGDEVLAIEIGRLLPGDKTYARSSETASALRRQIHEAQPAIVVLDVTMGGQRWSAMATLGKILAVRSAPALVLITPWSSRKVDRVAAAAGCYDVVPRSLKDATTARMVAAKIHEARQWREEQLSSGAHVDGVLH